MKRNLLMTLVMLLLTATVAAQTSITVSGTVSDKKGDPIIGATVTMKGNARIGTTTDLNGHYTLGGVSQDATLVFSYIGMKEQLVSVARRRTIDVVMAEANEELNEVVVVGYGVQRKSDLTGAVAAIKPVDLLKTPTTNAVNALQGRVSGVFVSTNGAPGSEPEIRIRGIGTTNDASPLFVVDGMFMDGIAYLNSNDIASIEVLKDASATAMYGSRGANGVIIVTTKQGSEGKVKVNVTASEGIQFENSDFDMCDASQYATLLNEAMANTGGTPLYDNPSTLGKGTNWFDEIFRTAWTQEYGVSASGGSKKTRYNLSAGYNNQEGIIQGNRYDRLTLRANNVYQINSRVNIGHNISASFSHTKNQNTDVVASAYRISPIVKPYNDDGTFMDSGSGSSANPAATLNYLHSDSWADRIVGSGYLNWNILKGLNFKTSLGIDWQNLRSRSYTPKYYVSETQKSDTNSLTKTWTRNFTWLWENTLTYDWQIDKQNRLNLLAGITAQKHTNEVLGGSGRDFFTDAENYWYIDRASAESKSATNNGYQEAMMSYLFRANYALKDRYLLTASLRADGSSKFGPEKRWGYFPSAAVAWRVSEEPFVKENADWLSNLKLRVSWGQIGNDKIGNDRYYAIANVSSTYDAIFNNVYYPGGTITSLYNNQVHWERTQQLDFGMDLGLWNNRLALELDWYRKDTKDMLVNAGVPGSVGLTAVETNVGSVRNSGLDFTAKWEDNINDFHYAVRLTGTTISNKVTNLAGKTITGGSIGTGKSVKLTEEGRPIGYFYGYQVIGLFQSQDEIDRYNAAAAAASGKEGQKYQPNDVAPGDLIFRDMDGNGFINDQDRTDIGNPTPKFIGGLGLSASWRGFDLSLDFQGNFGNKIYNAKAAARFSGSDNWDTSFLDRWTPDHTATDVPRMTLEGNNYQISSRFVYSGTYVKLQNAELGYAFPRSWMQKLLVSNLRLYVAGSNLLYFSNYPGFTPEITGGIDNTIYPITASCRFGLQLTF
ncbi:MAG: TonB-dependent receptor [Mediterranea sp.]|nr:TonB-dependent receptor [Mediterranea sp.]